MARCRLCNQRGRCSCQRRINAEIARKPENAPRPCGRMCGRNGKDTACGRTARGGACPCPDC